MSLSGSEKYSSEYIGKPITSDSDSRIYGPSYGPPRQSYGPGRTPEREPNDLEARAIELANQMAERDYQRSLDRYSFKVFGKEIRFLSKAKAWLNRSGERSKVERLDQIGLEQYKEKRERRWLKIGTKVLGGFGSWAAITFGGIALTGPVGAALMPTLWSASLREGIDGLMEMGEQIGWGEKRIKTEFQVQTELSGKLNELRQAAESGRFEDFARIENEIKQIENTVIQEQDKNMTSERKFQTGRAISSSLLTAGIGIMGGMPLGWQDYDKGVTPVTPKIPKGFLDQYHRVIWKIGGPEFIYNPHEAEGAIKAAAEVGKELTKVDSPIRLLAAKGSQLTTLMSDFWGATHTLGHGLGTIEKTGLGGAFAYLFGRGFDGYQKKTKGDAWNTMGPGYGPPREYGPRRGYGPGRVYGPPRGPEGPTPPEELKQIIPENPVNSSEIIKNERESIQKYFENYPAYFQMIEKMASPIPKMSEKCIVSVCLPLYAKEKPDVIKKTLEKYINQKYKEGYLNPECYEINILVNAPTKDKKDIDTMSKELEEFKKKYPEIKINVIQKEFPRKENMGYIRKIITDITLLRSLNRDKQNNQHIIASADADLENLDDRYFEKIIGKINSNENIKLLITKMDYISDEIKKYPYLVAARRLWQFIDIIAKDNKYFGYLPKAGGPNTIFTAEGYSKADGYNNHDEIAEDIRLTYRVQDTFRTNTEAITYDNKIKITTSNRRDIDAAKNNIPLVRQYDKWFTTDIENKKLKPQDLEKIKIGSPEFKKKLENEATELFNVYLEQRFWRLFDKSPEAINLRSRHANQKEFDDLAIKLSDISSGIGKQSLEDAKKIFDKALGLWGVKYNLTFDKNDLRRIIMQRDNPDDPPYTKITFTDTKKLEGGLEKLKKSVETK